ncbi:MAG: HAD family hydrolase [Candidatus Comchoanobacterales bacterium]
MNTTKPLLIFDFDGTLFDSQPAVISSFQKTLCHFSHPKPSSERLLQLYQKGYDLATTLKHLCPENTTQEHKLMADHYLTIHLNDLIHLGEWYQDALFTLETLKQHYTLIIASNRNQKSLIPIIEHYQISNWFSAVLGTMFGAPFKPCAEKFKNLLPCDLQEFPIRAVIGDTMVDYRFAEQLDCDFIWADYGYGQRPVIMNHINQLKALIPILI